MGERGYMEKLHIEYRMALPSHYLFAPFFPFLLFPFSSPLSTLFYFTLLQEMELVDLS